MKKIETPLDGAFIIEPQVFGDVRGWFYESYSKQKMHDIGIDVEFVQAKWDVIVAGLKCCQGKCIVNSISLKEGLFYMFFTHLLPQESDV